MSGTDPSARKGTDLEELAEDIFGLNFRSFRTLRDLIVRPRAVFMAYAEGDRETYTPAVRLWLTLIGLQVVTSFLWGGQGDLVYDQLTSVPREQLDIPLGTTDADAATYDRRLSEFAAQYGELSALLHAPLVGLFAALNVFTLKTRSHPLSWVRRLNITFGILTAGSILGLLLSPFIAVHPAAGLVSLPLIFGLYFITVFRGSPGVLVNSQLARWLRSLLYATTTILLVLVGGVILMLICMTASFFLLPPLPA